MVVRAKPRPVYSWEIPGTHRTGGWWAPGPVWTGADNFASPRSKCLKYKFGLQFRLNGSKTATGARLRNSAQIQLLEGSKSGLHLSIL